MKKSIFIGFIIVLLVIALFVLFYYYYGEKSAMNSITTFDDCVANGYPITESNPSGCSLPDGRKFTEEINNQPNDVASLIRVDSPAIGQTVKNPITIVGEARGSWYFEAVFPVKLLDSQGNEIASAQAQAQGEWMTENLVPFKATINFGTSTGNGTLLLMNDNPSGLPENSKELRIPIVFGTTSTSTKK